MGRNSITVIVLTGLLGGFAPFASMPHAAAQVVAAPVQAPIQGEVTQKFTSERDDNYMIAVNGQPYSVPPDIYDRVDVGTVVQFDGTNWTIISGGI